MLCALGGGGDRKFWGGGLEKWGGEITVLQRPIAGSPTRLRFVSRMESMDASRALNLKAAQDPVFQKYLAEMALLVDGSKTFDEIWQ